MSSLEALLAVLLEKDVVLVARGRCEENLGGHNVCWLGCPFERPGLELNHVALAVGVKVHAECGGVGVHKKAELAGNVPKKNRLVRPEDDVENDKHKRHGNQKRGSYPQGRVVFCGLAKQFPLFGGPKDARVLAQVCDNV